MLSIVDRSHGERVYLVLEDVLDDELIEIAHLQPCFAQTESDIPRDEAEHHAHVPVRVEEAYARPFILVFADVDVYLE